jgi:hypothetical protein
MTTEGYEGDFGAIRPDTLPPAGWFQGALAAATPLLGILVEVP